MIFEPLDAVNHCDTYAELYVVLNTLYKIIGVDVYVMNNFDLKER